jgi:hypothetical protein
MLRAMMPVAGTDKGVEPDLQRRNKPCTFSPNLKQKHLYVMRTVRLLKYYGEPLIVRLILK